jgi:hypothetical protein
LTALPVGDPITAGVLALSGDEDPILTIEGQAPTALALVGSRSRLATSVTQSGNQWIATIRQRRERWGRDRRHQLSRHFGTFSGGRCAHHRLLVRDVRFQRDRQADLFLHAGP